MELETGNETFEIGNTVEWNNPRPPDVKDRGPFTVTKTKKVSSHEREVVGHHQWIQVENIEGATILETDSENPQWFSGWYFRKLAR